MSIVLQVPEKAPKDVVLTYKYTYGDKIASLEAANELLLKTDNVEIDGANTICKFFASKHASDLLGKTALEQAQVEEWLGFVATSLRNKSKKDILLAMEKKLDTHLSQQTYFVANRLTLVDIVIFGIVHSYTKNMKVTTMPNVMRWFDLVQHDVVVKHNLVEDFPLFQVDLDDVPEPVIAAPQEAEKKAKAANKDATKDNKKDATKENKKDNNKNSKEEGATKTEANPDKKEKKKKEKKEKAPAAPAAAETDQSPISRVDIRVGYIRSCKKHDGADTLYVEEIDMGDGEGVYRTVVSGLVKYYSIEEMENRYILCIANLKPASMRGVKSEGMVLCATSPDGSKVELLAPVDTSKVKPGDRVYFDGLEGEPEKVLPPKKKYWETVQPDFKTSDDRVAFYQDKPFLIKTASGEAVQCHVPSVQGGSIK